MDLDKLAFLAFEPPETAGSPRRNYFKNNHWIYVQILEVNSSIIVATETNLYNRI